MNALKLQSGARLLICAKRMASQIYPDGSVVNGNVIRVIATRGDFIIDHQSAWRATCGNCERQAPWANGVISGTQVACRVPCIVDERRYVRGLTEYRADIVSKCNAPPLLTRFLKHVVKTYQKLDDCGFKQSVRLILRMKDARRKDALNGPVRAFQDASIEPIRMLAIIGHRRPR